MIKMSRKMDLATLILGCIIIGILAPTTLMAFVSAGVYGILRSILVDVE